MGSIIFKILFFSNAIVALVHPWIGVIAVYTIGILTPQNIWWWHFVNGRPYYWTAIPLIFGYIFAVLRNKVTYTYLNSPLFFASIIMFLTMLLSYYFGEYTKVFNEYHFFDVDFVFIKFIKIFLIFFISVCLIDSIKKAKYLSFVLVLSTCYLIYWANLQYLSGKVLGRLHGPVGLGISIYNDENIFAMLFVVGIPFVFYFGSSLSRWYVKYCLWLFIPFGWHAIFLTGSRGGLIALMVTTAIVAARLNNRWLKIALIPALLIAFLWQGGSIMKQRSHTITQYERDQSAIERIEAWSAAIKMVAKHPITGVGLASMGQAYPFFSSYPDVRIAHNTFLQLCAENGIFSGFSYLFIIFYSILRLWNGSFSSLGNSSSDVLVLYYLNEALLTSIIGFFVCSIFLSLQEYEIFYFLIILSNFVIMQKVHKRSKRN